MTADVFKACVIGVGSPNGIDRAGWKVVEGLESLLPKSVRTELSVEPTRLLSLFSEYEQVWIVDACRSDQQAGEITRFSWPDQRVSRSWSLSGHGVGLAETLELANTLGSLPNNTILYTININNCSTPDSPESELSEEISTAVQEVRDLLVDEITQTQLITET